MRWGMPEITFQSQLLPVETWQGTQEDVTDHLQTTLRSGSGKAPKSSLTAP